MSASREVWETSASLDFMYIAIDMVMQPRWRGFTRSTIAEGVDITSHTHNFPSFCILLLVVSYLSPDTWIGD